MTYQGEPSLRTAPDTGLDVPCTSPLVLYCLAGGLALFFNKLGRPCIDLQQFGGGLALLFNKLGEALHCCSTSWGSGGGIARRQEG